MTIAKLGFCLWGAAVLAALAAVSPGSTANAAEGTGADDPAVLNFGIVPQQSASRLAQMWAPVLRHLSEEANVEVRFQTTRDIPTFEACLAAGHYDIAYMNPYHYAVFSDMAGYRALAHQTEKRLRGIVVVRKDSDVESIDQLQGQVVAFPSPGAFGASVLPRAEMRARGIDFNPAYVKSHDSVYRAVAAGIMPAGGGVVRTFNAIEPELRDQLRVVYRTEAYTPHAIATAPDVTSALRTVLQQVMANLATTAPEAARSIGMQGLRAAADSDWDDVRGLAIDTDQAGLETGEKLKCPSG